MGKVIPSSSAQAPHFAEARIPVDAPTTIPALNFPETLPGRKPPRSWRDKFGDAFRGLKLGVRGHSSFFVHFFFGALVFAAGIVLRCSLVEWCILLGCIGMVLIAELFNSAIETLFHGLDEASKPRRQACLDIAAGAVLLASIVAAVIGGLVFVSRLVELFGTQVGE